MSNPSYEHLEQGMWRRPQTRGWAFQAGAGEHPSDEAGTPCSSAAPKPPFMHGPDGLAHDTATGTMPAAIHHSDIYYICSLPDTTR